MLINHFLYGFWTWFHAFRRPSPLQRHRRKKTHPSFLGVLSWIQFYSPGPPDPGRIFYMHPGDREAPLSLWEAGVGHRGCWRLRETLTLSFGPGVPWSLPLFLGCPWQGNVVSGRPLGKRKEKEKKKSKSSFCCWSRAVPGSGDPSWLGTPGWGWGATPVHARRPLPTSR